MSWPEYTKTALKSLPLMTGGGFSLTPASSWADMASWVEVITSTSTAITVAGITVDPGVAQEFEVDIGKGTASSETLVGTIAGHFDTTDARHGTLLWKFPISNIPVSTRVAMRMRKNGTTNTAWTYGLIYYATATPEGITTTTQTYALAPSAALGVSVTPSGSAFGESSKGEFIASTASETLPIGVIVEAGVGSVEVDIILYKGAAGSEVEQGRIRTYLTLTGGPHYYEWPTPMKRFAAGVRLSGGIAKTGTSTAVWRLKLHYAADPI